MTDLFYCYSKRLTRFLQAFDMHYLSVGENKNAGTRYWTFEKSDRLDSLLALWNEIKHR